MTVLRIVTLALIVVLCCFPVSSLTGLHGWCHSCRSCQVCPVLMLRAAPNMFADQVQPFCISHIFTLPNPSIQTRQKNCLRPKIPTHCGRRNGMVNIVSLDLKRANWVAGLPLQPWLTRSIQHVSVEVGELGASVMYFNAISVGAEKDLNGVDSKKHPKGIRPQNKTKNTLENFSLGYFGRVYNMLKVYEITVDLQLGLD